MELVRQLASELDLEMKRNSVRCLFHNALLAFVVEIL